MKVLVACEESQAVCKEFRKLGHGGTVGRWLMIDSIMFIPALVLAVAEIAALVVMIRGWRMDKDA